MRLLDVGCGWGGMLLHAAEHHGVHAVGVTVSRRQAELAEKRVAEAGLADRVEIRLQDYRDVADGPFDAISSIGMFEHVGRGAARDVLRPLLRAAPARAAASLNHAISRPPHAGEPVRAGRARFARRSFIDRYVFPDGELHEVGAVVVGDPAGRVRGPPRREPARALRAHAARVGREPRGELGRGVAESTAGPGPGLAPLHGGVGAAASRRTGSQVHQVLAVRPDGGDAGLPLRPRFEGPA